MVKALVEELYESMGSLVTSISMLGLFFFLFNDFAWKACVFQNNLINIEDYMFGSSVSHALRAIQCFVCFVADCLLRRLWSNLCESGLLIGCFLLGPLLSELFSDSILGMFSIFPSLTYLIIIYLTVHRSYFAIISMKKKPSHLRRILK